MNVVISSIPNFLLNEFSNFVYGHSNLLKVKCIIHAHNGKDIQTGSLNINNGTLDVIIHNPI